MSACTTGDCDCYTANRNYYQAALVVDNATLTVDQNQKNLDYSAYYLYLELMYEYGCISEGSAPTLWHRFLQLFRVSSATWSLRVDAAQEKLRESKLLLTQAQQAFATIPKPRSVSAQ